MKQSQDRRQGQHEYDFQEGVPEGIMQYWSRGGRKHHTNQVPHNWGQAQDYNEDAIDLYLLIHVLSFGLCFEAIHRGSGNVSEWDGLEHQRYDLRFSCDLDQAALIPMVVRS